MGKANREETIASSVVVSRRDLFTLLGSAVVLVACGTKSKTASPITASELSSGGSSASANDSASANGSAAANGGAPASAAAGNGSAAGIGSTSGTNSTAHISGPHATGADAMTVADAQREAGIANGHWQGGWHDATGASGDSDLVIAIDAASRTAKATVSFGGELFGTPLPSVTYDIDLLSFMMTADSYDVASPQFGQVTIVPGGSTNASGTARAVPGQPTIDHIDVNGTMAGRRVDVGYTVHYVDGHSVKGTMAWTPTGGRATPAALGSAGAPTTADIASGAYAAALLDASALTTIFGEPFQAPQSNGGNLLYDNGIATSNAEADAISGDYNLAYTVYVGTNAADTAAFWQKQNPGLTTTPGPWQAGFYYPGVGFYAELPTRAFVVKINPLKQTAPPTAQQSAMIQQLAVQVATALTNSLKTA